MSAAVGPAFRAPWWHIFRNPAFIARRGLYRAMVRFAETTGSPKGDWLDVGCGSRPYEHLFPSARFTGMDVELSGHDPADKRCDVTYDGRTFPLEDAIFDAVLCTQVLEHAEDPEALIAEVARVLRPGGYLILTAPFMWPEHELPYDFRRYTAVGLAKTVRAAGMEILSVSATSTESGALAQFASAWLHRHVGRDIPAWSGLITLAVCAPVQAVGLLVGSLESRPPSFYLDTAMLARRSGAGS